MTDRDMTPKLELPPDRPPLYVSAGLVKTESQISLYAGLGLAAQVIGDFSMNEHAPPSPGRLFYYDEASHAAYNAFQLRNPGRKEADRYLPEGVKIVHGAGQLAVIGVTPLKHEDPLVVVPDLVEWGCETGADAIEINTSCPNEDSDELLCYDLTKTKEVIDAVRQRVGEAPYLMLKVSSLSSEQIERYKKVLRVDAISPINSERKLSPPDPETSQSAILVNGGYAGQSGPAIRELAHRNLADWTREPGDLATLLRRFDVWSVGGVDDGYDAHYRVHGMGAMMVGGAQAFYKAAHPKVVAERWIREYEEALGVARA